MLATLLRPTRLTRVLGHDIVAEAERCSLVTYRQARLVDEDLTGRENLILIGRLLGFRRAMKARANQLPGLRNRHQRPPRQH